MSSSALWVSMNSLRGATLSPIRIVKMRSASRASSISTRTMKRVEIEDALEADRIFTILMGDKVAPRREFIETHSAELDMAALDI